MGACWHTDVAGATIAVQSSNIRLNLPFGISLVERTGSNSKSAAKKLPECEIFGFYLEPLDNLSGSSVGALRKRLLSALASFERLAGEVNICEPLPSDLNPAVTVTETFQQIRECQACSSV